MSDFRDPRDPVHRDPLYGSLDPGVRQARAEAFSPGTAVAWFVGIALFIGLLIFAFGGTGDRQVAETTPPAATDTQPAPAPSAPPAKNPAAPAQ